MEELRLIRLEIPHEINIYPKFPPMNPLYQTPPKKLPPLNTPFLHSPDFHVEFSNDDTHLRE